jgi:hypothetical protein
MKKEIRFSFPFFYEAIIENELCTMYNENNKILSMDFEFEYQYLL